MPYLEPLRLLDADSKTYMYYLNYENDRIELKALVRNIVSLFDFLSKIFELIFRCSLSGTTGTADRVIDETEDCRIGDWGPPMHFLVSNQMIVSGVGLTLVP